MSSLLELFCSIDDFCQIYEPMLHQMLLENGLARRQRSSRMSLSEMMTLVVHFHQKQFRNFKIYYTEYVLEYLGHCQVMDSNLMLWHDLMMKKTTHLFKNHRYPPEIIQYAVWFYFAFPLSFRDVELLLHQ